MQNRLESLHVRFSILNQQVTSLKVIEKSFYYMHGIVPPTIPIIRMRGRYRPMKTKSQCSAGPGSGATTTPERQMFGRLLSGKRPGHCAHLHGPQVRCRNATVTFACIGNQKILRARTRKHDASARGIANMIGSSVLIRTHITYACLNWLVFATSNNRISSVGRALGF